VPAAEGEEEEREAKFELLRYIIRLTEASDFQWRKDLIVQRQLQWAVKRAVERAEEERTGDGCMKWKVMDEIRTGIDFHLHLGLLHAMGWKGEGPRPPLPVPSPAVAALLESEEKK
jgi:hypothetical protein